MPKNLDENQKEKCDDKLTNSSQIEQELTSVSPWIKETNIEKMHLEKLHEYFAKEIESKVNTLSKKQKDITSVSKQKCKEPASPCQDVTPEGAKNEDTNFLKVIEENVKIILNKELQGLNNSNETRIVEHASKECCNKTKSKYL